MLIDGILNNSLKMHAKYYTRIHIVKALQVLNINFFLHGIIHE